MARNKKTKSKKKLSKEEIAERRKQSSHKKLVRTAFIDAGFIRAPDFSDKEFTYEQTTSDFDDVFIWENVIVLTEYTIKKNGHSDHLKKKHFLYNKITEKPADFYHFLTVKSDDIRKSSASRYTETDIQIRIIYCTTTDPDDTLKNQIDSVKFYDYPIAMYFKALGSSIKRSARYELLEYLGVPFEDAGENCHSVSGVARDPFNGSLLPEAHSNLGSKYKIVSFYISPEALLERAYVLRKEGWRDSDWLYQRLISQKKIESIRNFLNLKGRVFLNNIIVTLPSNCKIVNKNDDTIDSSTLNRTTPAIIQIPRKFNTIGLIDGQHRVFSYHEGGKFEEKISNLRKRLNLLVTGIIYPENLSEADRLKFEAEIFLEINSNQAGAKSDLKHAITSIITPFDSTSIAKRVLNRLNRSGALADIFIKYFYDTMRLKTTTVISYGIRHLVHVSPEGPLFSRWDHSEKLRLLDADKDIELLDVYVEYCYIEIRRWFNRVRDNTKPGQWEIKSSEGLGILNTTTVIGFMNYFRIALGRNISIDDKSYDGILADLPEFDYSIYKSSQYGAMARKLEEICYK